MVVDDSRYWSYGYLAGVYIGLLIAIPVFLDAGLLSVLGLMIYSGLGIGAIAL